MNSVSNVLGSLEKLQNVMVEEFCYNDDFMVSIRVDFKSFCEICNHFEHDTHYLDGDGCKMPYNNMELNFPQGKAIVEWV